MYTSTPGILLPAADAERELTLSQAAEVMGIHVRRLRRWLASWLAQGVTGIRKVPHPGGYAYAIVASLPERWINCELPSPYDNPAPRAAHESQAVPPTALLPRG